MNIAIEMPNFGFGTPGRVPVQQEDMRRTRQVFGTDSEALSVPGLSSVERVRFRGGEIETRIVMQLPMDVSQRNFLTIQVPGYRLMEVGPDGAYLERSIFSNDGIWQKGEPFWITGEWDESINPPSPLLGPPPETVRRPILTEGPAEPAEVTRAASRGRERAATEAQSAKE